MVDRHAVKQMLGAGLTVGEVARHFGVSSRTVKRIRKEAPIESVEDAEARRQRRVGRPSVADGARERMRALRLADPGAPRLELLRQIREEGVALGESTFYRVLAEVEGTIPQELMVRFEGVAGEFAQFDFGQAGVQLVDGSQKRVHFAAYRLKYSRWVHVVVVPNERIEALVRALLDAFERSGGVPLAVVFDQAKTVVTGQEDGRPVWNTTLAQVAIDYGFAVELCAPHSPEQKGSVENLVGFVKRSFFRARRFLDLEEDLPRQLEEWLVETNEVRPSRATGVAPAARLGAEQERMRPLATQPAEYGLRFPVQVGPTALVSFQGVRYAMPAEACGLPATLHLYPNRVKIVAGGGRHEVLHARFPLFGNTCYLAGQRSEQLAAVAGARKRLYFMRERILELGPVGEGYLTGLIHHRPYTWKGDVERLFSLLEEIGDESFLRALRRCLFQSLYGAEYVRDAVRGLREVAQ